MSSFNPATLLLIKFQGCPSSENNTVSQIISSKYNFPNIFVGGNCVVSKRLICNDLKARPHMSHLINCNLVCEYAAWMKTILSRGNVWVCKPDWASGVVWVITGFSHLKPETQESNLMNWNTLGVNRSMGCCAVCCNDTKQSHGWIGRAAFVWTALVASPWVHF